MKDPQGRAIRYETTIFGGTSAAPTTYRIVAIFLVPLERRYGIYHRLVDESLLLKQALLGQYLNTSNGRIPVYLLVSRTTSATITNYLYRFHVFQTGTLKIRISDAGNIIRERNAVMNNLKRFLESVYVNLC